jgi:hypothetical protein
VERNIVYSQRVRDWRYTTGWDEDELELEGNNSVGWDMERVSFEIRKNLRRTLINARASSIVDEAPNEMRTTPRGFFPPFPPNSSTHDI